jgi:hypothetical protein
MSKITVSVALPHSPRSFISEGNTYHTDFEKNCQAFWLPEAVFFENFLKFIKNLVCLYYDRRYNMYIGISKIGDIAHALRFILLIICRKFIRRVGAIIGKLQKMAGGMERGGFWGIVSIARLSARGLGMGDGRVGTKLVPQFSLICTIVIPKI